MPPPPIPKPPITHPKSISHLDNKSDPLVIANQRIKTLENLRKTDTQTLANVKYELRATKILLTKAEEALDTAERLNRDLQETNATFLEKLNNMIKANEDLVRIKDQSIFDKVLLQMGQENRQLRKEIERYRAADRAAEKSVKVGGIRFGRWC